MKFLIAVLAVISVCRGGVLHSEPRSEDGRYIYFPGDGDDKLHLVDLEELPDEAFIGDYLRNPDNNGYWLYTRSNPTNEQVLHIGDEDSVRQSNLDNNKDIVVLAHGWNGNGRNSMNRKLTEAFLERYDVNVIVLDWGRLANRNYVTARNGVPPVGQALGQFLAFLTSLGASFDKMHLVGFSLGGHLVGIASREVNSQVKRITALDPAGPLWSENSLRIRESDGQYVEIIHTNTGLSGLGYSGLAGHVDHFPNGGSSMPGCWISSCSHTRAHDYMAASIRYNNLHGNECNTLRDAERNRCNGDLFEMGNGDTNKNGNGIFRVNTGRNYPY